MTAPQAGHLSKVGSESRGGKSSVSYAGFYFLCLLLPAMPINFPAPTLINACRCGRALVAAEPGTDLAINAHEDLFVADGAMEPPVHAREPPVYASGAMAVSRGTAPATAKLGVSPSLR